MMRSLLLTAIFLFQITAFAQSDDRTLLEKTNRDISVSMQKGDLKTAARLAQEAIEISRKVYGENARQLAIAYENLGVILAADEKFKLAVAPLKRSLEIFQVDPSRNGSDITKVMERVGDALSRAGLRKEAETMFADAVASAKKMFGEESKEVISAKIASACFYGPFSQPERSFHEFAESYALALKKFGRDSTELDQVAIACGGRFIASMDLDQPRSDALRKKMNEVLGYELGKPTKLEQADVNITSRKIGVPNLRFHTVVVKVWVNASGLPTDAKMVFGENHFASFANSAARISRFKPSLEGGKAIPDVFYISYLFVR